VPVEEDIVIEALTGFPDNIMAWAFHGHVTKADYETVLIPDIEDKLSRHKKVRLYCEVAPDYVGVAPGAVWEDTKVGFRHLFDWDRAVIVTDLEWMQHAMKFFGGLFGFLLPEWRVFPTAEADKAREWVVEAQ
jgi:SpoIIAA-like